MKVQKPMTWLEKSARYVLAGGLIGQMVYVTEAPQWRTYLVLAGVYLVTTALTGWDPLSRLARRFKRPVVVKTAGPQRVVVSTQALRAANDSCDKVALIRTVK